MKTISIILLALILPLTLSAQQDQVKSKLSFEGDFRFRAEQDWSSKKSDGSYRDDRTRFRYRVRAGVEYQNKWYKTGFRLRTGNPAKQQDPQLTLGAGFKEFGTLPIGLEKAYFQGEHGTLQYWLGKNTFPFEKSNELFWSDNVYPEGIFFSKEFRLDSEGKDRLAISVGHFILSSTGKSLEADTYFQGYQTHLALFNNQLELFPSLYLFKNVPNIPDGGETFELDYSIFHIGTRIKVMEQSKWKIELDYYYNFQDLNEIDSISTDFRDQNTGMVAGLKYGSLKEKGDWTLQASYAYLERYSAVDFMAQNDWVRWDYSSFGSPDGRLTNLNGIEIVVGYKLDERAVLKMKYYLVEQLIATGTAKETGSRIRLDIDVKF